MIDIDISYSNESFVTSPDNIPLSQLSTNILTTTVAITLPDDQNYIATVTFSNMFDVFNITSYKTFSKFSIKLMLVLQVNMDFILT